MINASFRVLEVNLLSERVSPKPPHVIYYVEEDDTYYVWDTPLNSWKNFNSGIQSLQDVVNVSNGISNYGGIGNASIQSTNFVNNRTLYLNNDAQPTVAIVDNLNSANNLTIDLNTLTLDNVSYNWADIVNQGTVTSVTATTPLSSTGGVTPNISIQQASASQDGYLSSTDWSTFNTKQDSIAAGTIGQYWRGDKTWQTLNTTAVAEGTSLYFTEARTIASILTGLTVTGGTVTSTDSILSAFGKLQNQLNAVASPMIYQGTWNASTNFPVLTSSTGTKGYVYRVTTSGSTNIDGITDWKSGDFIVYNGSTWDKWDSTDAVTSINGYTGAVTLVKADVGLSNVENTALSTWAGSTNITTVGTIGSGTWQGTAIADTYISSAATWNAKVGGTGTVNYVPYWGSSNTLSSTSSLYIDSTSGNVGINQLANESFTLDIKSLGGSTSTVRLKGVSNGSAYYGTKSGVTATTLYAFGDSAAIIGGASDVLSTLYSTVNMNFFVGSSEVIRINTSGNVGIGNTNPTSKLHITGDVNISTILNATTDTDRFLVSDSGVIKYRTGAELLSDVGAQGSINLTTTGTSGAATLVGNTLNIPQYSGGGGSGSVTSVGLSMPAAFTVSNSPVTSTGTLTVIGAGTTSDYIRGDGTLATFPTALPVANIKHLVKYAEALTKGQAVYVSSADGTNMLVSKASNASEATSSKTLGLVTASGAANYQGEVITEGLLAGLDTSTATDGDAVWLGTNGNLIFWHYGLTTKPVAPAHLVFIGIVTRVNANNGEIFVKPQNGFEIDELHDVSVVGRANNTLLGYNSATSLHEFKTVETWLGYTPVAGSGTTNYLAKFTAAGSIGDSAVFESGGNVGIGTTSPNAKLEVSGNAILGSGNDTSNYATTIICSNDITNPRGLFVTRNSNNQGLHIHNGDGAQVAIDAIGFSPKPFVIRNRMNEALIFSTNDTSRMYIAASGNVGIDTTTPSAKLHINNISTENSFLVEDATNPDATPFLIDTDGNVGVGTLTPLAKLHVHEPTILGTTGGSYSLLTTVEGNGSGNAVYKNLYTYRDANGSDWLTTRIHDSIGIDNAYKTPGVDTRTWYERDPYNSIHSWGSSSITYMTIALSVSNTAGNVGIGTTTPSASLHINNADNQNSFLVEDANPDSSPFVIDANGNVGMGTLTPASVLHIKANPSSTSTATIRLESDAVTANSSIGHYSGGIHRWEVGTGINLAAQYEILDRVAGQTRFSITTSGATVFSNGNVGIGTATPGATLEVNGDVKISTILNANTNTNTFLVSDSGVVKYRTGTEVLSDIGMSNVNNTSDLNKPISTATQTALNLITDVNWLGDYNNGYTYSVGDGVMFNGASFRMYNYIGAAGYPPSAYPGNWKQITDYVSPNDIGLGNVDNTSDLNKPISTATQTALNLKMDTNSSIDAHNDVTITSPIVNQILQWNGSQWINASGSVVNAGPGVVYFLTDTPAGFGTYEYMSKTPDGLAEIQETVIVNNNTVLIHEYISDVAVNKTTIDAGIWEFNLFGYVDTLNANFVVDVYKRTTGGTETLLFSAETELISWTAVDLSSVTTVQQQFTCDATDKLVVKVSGKTTQTSNVTLKLAHSGTTHYSHIHTPLTVVHNDIAGLQGGATGEYFHLNSAANTKLLSWQSTGIPDTDIQSASTWNSKIGGSGSANYISKFTASGTIGNSLIQDDGTGLSIGISSPYPGVKFYVASTDIAIVGNGNTYGVQGKGTQYGVWGESTSDEVGNHVGVYGSAGDIDGGGATYIGGRFVGGGANGTNHSLWLQDNTEGVGKFLKSITSDGKANWATLTVADTGLTLTTTGSGEATLVGNTLNVPQTSVFNYGISYIIATQNFLL